jgi:hypothetical protein
MKFGNSGDTYNVGSGYPVQMYELLTRILNRSGMDINAVEINQGNIIGNKSDVQIIYADISKIKQLRR